MTTTSSSGSYNVLTVSSPSIGSDSHDGHRQLTDQIIEIQHLSHAPQSTITRRALWFWLLVYVCDKKDKVTNVRVPIPIPLVGLFFPRELDTKRALSLVELLANDANNPKAVREYLDTIMPVEFVRVDGDGELVIVGFE